jgi:hypothetical protein
VPIDFTGSARATALVVLVTASFSSPIIVKGDALSSVSNRLGGGAASQPAPEQLVAGGYSYAKPAAWGRLGATASSDAPSRDAQDSDIGTVVGGVCPGGSAGGSCIDDVQVTFVAYSGKSEDELPAITSLEEELDTKLAAAFSSFGKSSVESRPMADGSRWLRYEFTFKRDGVLQREVLGAFRHVDGSGVIAVAAGPDAAFGTRVKAIDAFLASAHEVGAAS